ncbi:MAG: S8 family serine peptidase [Rubrivivax sp.]|jgi:hypothetical protein|nr:S8 family serine peptidase [Rubrivivax sp.]
MRPWTFSLTAVAAALLAACGGGDPIDPDASAAQRQASGVASVSTASTGTSAASASTDVVVQLKVGATISNVASRYRLTVIDRFGKRPIWTLRPAAGLDPNAVVTALRNDGEVEFAERVRNGATPESRRISVWAIGGSQTSYGTHWARDAMRLPQAQQITRGDGIRVAVLDSGIDLDHPALVNRLSRDGSGRLRGIDLVDGDAVPAEVGTAGVDIGFGHGTHVAGLVLMAAPNARIMPVRVLDPAGRGNTWVLAEAIGWALDPDANPSSDDGAHVINLSLGTTQPTRLLELATELATCSFDDDDDFDHPGFDDDRARCDRGRAAVVFSAAGNSGTDTEVLYPAAEGVKGSAAITATQRNGRLASFANRGGWIPLAAPGASIVGPVPDNIWGTWSGTSMASPLAAGTAALLLRTLPPGGDPSKATARQWTPEAVIVRLLDRSRPICDASVRQVDALAALRDQQAPDPVCP